MTSTIEDKVLVHDNRVFVFCKLINEYGRSQIFSRQVLTVPMLCTLEPFLYEGTHSPLPGTPKTDETSRSTGVKCDQIQV